MPLITFDSAPSKHLSPPDLGPRLLFFSGGTALRGVAHTLPAYTSNSIHIVTTFDSGGSSAILRQAFNMPAVGDLRYRLMALADLGIAGNPEAYSLFETRLPQDAAPQRLRLALQDLAAGRHPLMRAMPEQARDIFRAYLQKFICLMPQNFDLRGASIGNLILAAGYLQNHRSLNNVLFMLSRLLDVRGIVRGICDAPAHLAVRYASGRVVTGQHRFTGKPQNPDAAARQASGFPERAGHNAPLGQGTAFRHGAAFGQDAPFLQGAAFGQGAGPLPPCSQNAPGFCQEEIADIWLTASENDPAPATVSISEQTAELVRNADLICYPIGSFYSSLVANLLPAGVGRAIAAAPCPKVFLPNPCPDPELYGHTLQRQVEVILRVLRQDFAQGEAPSAKAFLNAILLEGKAQYPGGLPEKLLESLNIKTYALDDGNCDAILADGSCHYLDPDAVCRALVALCHNAA